MPKTTPLLEFPLYWKSDVFLAWSFSNSLQTHHVHSMVKQRGNDRFHLVSTWNTRSVFLGLICKGSFFKSNLELA